MVLRKENLCWDVNVVLSAVSPRCSVSCTDLGPFYLFVYFFMHTVRDAHDYLRAMMKQDERSERALNLTTDVIALNSANYTLWYVPYMNIH